MSSKRRLLLEKWKWNVDVTPRNSLVKHWRITCCSQLHPLIILNFQKISVNLQRVGCIFLLSSLAPFCVIMYRMRITLLQFRDSPFMGSTQDVHYEVSTNNYRFISFFLFLIATSFFGKRPSYSCLEIFMVRPMRLKSELMSDVLSMY